ncbi:DUF2125 domain-containing protein [Roseomonas sp. AR75]|uniref:DUF2125 domain-containing protein n=1 Tax=Roseomonas sp. AR75 TaxID=2562311 RepID=UPI0010C0E624|nr:DUF2125 domain-containing protein [Roseomonas sp. AR75]
MNRKTPTRAARRLLLLLAIGLVAVAAGHAVLWRSMATELEEGWQTWVQLRRAQGWRVEHGPAVRGGWPFSATLTIDRVRLDGAAATLPGGLALTATPLVLRITLPRLDRLHVELPGQQRLRVGGIEYPFAADVLAAELPLETDTPPSSAELSAERLRIGSPAGGVEIRRLRLTAAGSASATETEPALAVTLTAERVELPVAPVGAGAEGFGRTIGSIAADLWLSGPLPAGRAPATRAEAWRDGGGTLELRALAVRWGPVGANAAATLAFDEALQPMGAGTLRITGATQALEALSEAGLVGRRAAATARTVLPLLSRPSAETGTPEVEVPVTLEDRTLALARIPVLRFAPLDWPRPTLPR